MTPGVHQDKLGFQAAPPGVGAAIPSTLGWDTPAQPVTTTPVDNTAILQGILQMLGGVVRKDGIAWIPHSPTSAASASYLQG